MQKINFKHVSELLGWIVNAMLGSVLKIRENLFLTKGCSSPSQTDSGLWGRVRDLHYFNGELQLKKVLFRLMKRKVWFNLVISNLLS